MIQITGDPSAERTAPPRSTHVRSGDVSSFLIQQGEGEVDGDPAARRRGGGSSGDLGKASPSSARGRGVTREREAPWARVRLPCASPLYIGVEGAGFLPSKSIGALTKVGGKKSHHFLPHRLLSPFLGILILSLRDMILFILRGGLGAP